MAGASAVVAQLASRLIRAIDPDEQLAPIAGQLLALAAALWFATSYSAGFAAVRPEVYALSTLLVVATLALLVRGLVDDEEAALRRAALLGGLALTNHHLLAGAAAVPVFYIMVQSRRRFAAAALAVCLALCVYAYLPLRASRHPVVNWGAPTTIARIVWTVSATAFQKSVKRSATTDTSELVGAITYEANILGLVGATLGFWVLTRRKRWAVAALLGTSSGLTILATAIVGFDWANPDAYGYLASSLALLAALAVLPIAAALRSRRIAIVAASGVLALAGLFVLKAPRFDLARRSETDAALGWLERAEPRRLVITSYFQTVFLLYYAQVVEGRRPDLRLVHRHFLAYPGYRDELIHRWADLAPLLGGRDVVTPLPPAVVEYDLDLPRPLVAGSTLPEVPLSDEPQARRFVGWMRYLAVHRACLLGDLALAERLDREAAPLLATDEDYRQLLLRCKNLGSVGAP